MLPATLYPAGAYALGLCLTLVLAAWLTPRRWWRRPNLLALAILAGGSWALGGLLLGLRHQVPTPAPAPAIAAAATAPAAIPPLAGQPFHAHHDLNLRGGAGVNWPLIATVPGGTALTPTGRREGDWWQLRATLNGRDSTGWASSLWLRRDGEMARE